MCTSLSSILCTVCWHTWAVLYVGIPELYSVLKLNLEELGVSSPLRAPGFLFRNLSIHSLSCCKDSLRNCSSGESSCSMKPLEPPRRTLTNITICKSVKIPLCVTCFLLEGYFARQWGKNTLKQNKIGHLKIWSYKFERAENFKYLVVKHNEDNNQQTDLQKRVKNANKTYCVLQNFLKIKTYLKNQNWY
jgi:hypothetical protein